MVDNNLALYDDTNHCIIIYGILVHKVVMVKRLEDIYQGGNVTRLAAIQDGEGYLLGFEDSTVVRISSVDLSVEEQFPSKNSGKVNDLWGNKNIVISVSDSGNLVIH